MTQIANIASLNQPARGQQTDLGDVDVSQFLDLLIAELQNQDPLDPLDNSEMIQQLGQLREISSTDLLSETLATVATGQNLASASSMIGKEIEALSDGGETVTGVVDRITVNVDEDNRNLRTYRVHIGEQSFDLDNVREIRQQSE